MEESVFAKQVNQYLSPQRPIKSPEHLKGRDIPLKELDRAIAAGATIFIYGDRGVGKTSLAQTSAFKHHPSDSSPIFLSCDKISNALYLVRELVAELVNNNPLATPNGQMKLGANAGIFSAEKTFAGKSARDIPEPKSVNEAVTLLIKAVEEWNPRKLDRWPVVVIDEFDRMSDHSQREFLGDLLKQIGDREVPIHMIFCGVSRISTTPIQNHSAETIRWTMHRTRVERAT